MKTPSIDEMIAELLALGWRRYRGNSTIWQAPDGRLFRGPYRAWTIATGNVEPERR